MNKGFVATVVSTLVVGLVQAQQPAPVKVEGGLVQGAIEDGLTVYRGIPFAAPPVGDLRWKAPQPVKAWDGVLQATKFADPQIAKTDLEISEAMATCWTNFAKRGDPNGEGVPAWPAFSDEKPVVMVFGQTPHTGPVPSLDSLKVLDEYFAWRRTAEGDTWAK